MGSRSLQTIVSQIVLFDLIYPYSPSLLLFLLHKKVRSLTGRDKVWLPSRVFHSPIICKSIIITRWVVLVLSVGTKTVSDLFRSFRMPCIYLGFLLVISKRWLWEVSLRRSPSTAANSSQEFQIHA